MKKYWFVIYALNPHAKKNQIQELSGNELRLRKVEGRMEMFEVRIIKKRCKFKGAKKECNKKYLNRCFFPRFKILFFVAHRTFIALLNIFSSSTCWNLLCMSESALQREGWKVIKSYANRISITIHLIFVGFGSCVLFYTPHLLVEMVKATAHKKSFKEKKLEKSKHKK